MRPDEPRADERLARALFALAALLAVLVALPLLDAPFYYDDIALVPSNALLRSTHGLWQMLTRARITSAPVWQGHYRPLFALTLWLQFQLFGASPTAFRAFNLLVHLVDGVLVLLFTRRVLARLRPDRSPALPSAFAATLFLLHPVQLETVALVLKRNSSLATAFLLGALLAWWPREGAPSRRRVLVSATLAALALLCKEDAIVFPLLILLFAWLLRLDRPLQRALPFVVAPLLFLVGVRPEQALTPSASVAYLLSQPLALARYAQMLVEPNAIAVAYDLRATLHPFPLARALALVAVALAVLAIVYSCGRRRPLPTLAVLWLVILLLPSSSLFPLYLTIDQVRLYPSLIFVFALVGVALAERRLLVVGALLAAMLLAGRASLTESARWRDPLALFQHTVERYPTSAIGNGLLCQERVHRRLPSVNECRAAVTHWPDDASTRYMLVAALAQSGRLDEAERALDRAFAELGERTPLDVARGHLRWMRDDAAGAVTAYRRALVTDPDNDAARVHLADSLLALGDPQGASAIVDSFGSSAPSDEDDQKLLAEVRHRLGR